MDDVGVGCWALLKLWRFDFLIFVLYVEFQSVYISYGIRICELIWNSEFLQNLVFSFSFFSCLSPGTPLSAPKQVPVQFQSFVALFPHPSCMKHEA